MNPRLVPAGILAVALVGCQDPEFINPDETNTGTPPPPPEAGVIFGFDHTRAPAFLDANLAQSNALQASFVNTEAGITVMPINGSLPDFAGSEANLLEGVGFGTYANADYSADVDWATAGDFKSVVTADITFTSPGDSVLICRSFATTCVELIYQHPLSAPLDLAIVRLAANAPDTEIGEIAAGVSAAIRGTGDGGLTIALTDEDVVGIPFNANAGEPFTLTWTIARGEVENSLDWSVAFGTAGTGLSGNTAANLATSIVKEGGVALVFDTELGPPPDPFIPPLSVDYYTEFDGTDTPYYDQPEFYVDPPGVWVDSPVALTPQVGLGFAPLYVYPTEDSAHSYGTTTGVDGLPHAVQALDGILGGVLAPDAASNQQFVYSVAFNGDDFDGTDFEGAVDHGIAGGGFYPSPTFCYSQIAPQVEAKIRAEVRKEAHRSMYAQIGTGVTSADLALPGLVTVYNTGFNPDLTYTPLSNGGPGYADGVLIGTDYADSNVDTAMSTSANAVYSVTLAQTKSLTFRTQFNAFMVAIDANNFAGRDFLFANTGGEFDADDYANLKRLQAGLNTPPGIEDGLRYGTAPGDVFLDEYPPFGTCYGTECNIQWVLNDVATGWNDSFLNASEGVPALGAACLWGVAGSDAVDATPAVLAPLDEDFDNDAPAYPATPAVPVTPPVRELAATSMNALVMGIYGNFIGAVFGPGVPASNFSLAMGAGDPDAATGPLITSLTITAVPPAE